MEDQADLLRSVRSPFDEILGLVVEHATPDEVSGVLPIDPDRHTQPLGMVHGGVHCTIVETLASLGAWLTARSAGRVPVGIENHTSFLRPVTEGSLHGVARPVARGSQTHLWEVLIHDDQGRLAARGSLRLALIVPREGAYVAGGAP